jgi:hypothetical protein
MKMVRYDSRPSAAELLKDEFFLNMKPEEVDIK